MTSGVIDSELVVLSCLLNDYYSLISLQDSSGDALSCFSSSQNKIICKAIIDVSDRKELVSLDSVLDDINNKKLLEQVGGYSYLVYVSEYSICGENLSFHVKKIIAKKNSDQLKKIGLDLTKADYLNYKDVINDVIPKIKNIEEVGDDDDFLPLSETIVSDTELIIEGEMNGVPWEDEWQFMNRIMPGVAPCCFSLLIAKSHAGKTTMMMSMVTSLICQGIPCFFLSSETERKKLQAMVLARLSGINFRTICTGVDSTGKYEGLSLEESKKILKLAKLIKDKNLPLLPIAHSSPTPSLVRRGIEKTKKFFNSCPAVFIDYIEMMSPDKGGQENRSYSLEKITQELRQLCLDDKMMMLVASQATLDEKKKTQMDSVFGSRAAVNAADLVFAIERPGVDDKNNEIPKNLVKLKVMKNKFRDTGEVYLMGDFATLTYKELTLEEVEDIYVSRL